MSRSSYKGPFVDNKLLASAIRVKSSNSTKLIYTRSRSSTITFDFMDLTIYVYNGKVYYPVKVTAEKLGHKFGALCFTKKKAVYKKKKKKK